MILFSIIAWISALLGNIHTACVPTNIQDIEDAVHHSQFAYEDNISIGDIVPSSTGYVVTQVVTEKYLGQKLQVVVSRRGSTTFISFRGTKGAKQLFQEFIKGAYMCPVWMFVGGKKTTVMSYWRDAFTHLDLPNKLKLHRNTKYIITGHSLGAALASLYSAVMTEKQDGLLWSNKDTRLITFGEPRVGHSDYADLHDQLIPPYKKVRVVYRLDFVPNWPLPIQRYVHASTMAWVIDLAFRKNIWVVCGRKEACYKRLLPFNALDHDIKRYISAVDHLKNDHGKGKKFQHDQCK